MEWLPLESNPETLTRYMCELGVSRDWALVDILDLQEDMLSYIPTPTKAIILLLPCENIQQKLEQKESEQNMCQDKNLYFMRQLVPNACGTVAVIHSVVNNHDIVIEQGVLESFVKNTFGLQPVERGQALGRNRAFSAKHRKFALDGGLRETAEREIVEHHFITLINFNNELVELDGLKQAPVKHGATTPEKFVSDAAAVCRQFIARRPGDVGFNAMALVPACFVN